MKLTKLQKRIQAYSQGYQAFLDGKESDKNPYEFSPLHDEWRGGWLAAAVDGEVEWE